MALEETLLGLGCDVTTVTVDEPSVAGTSRRDWLVRYWKGIRTTRPEEAAVCIALWPSLGYFDGALLRLFAGTRAALVVHDPVPLVRSLGMGRLGQLSYRTLGRRTELIVHSGEAARDVPSAIAVPTLLPHPLRRPTATLRPAKTDPVVRVLGRFKAGRDLNTLRTIADSAPAHWRLEIVGRGWPSIDRWQIRDEFVSERDFTVATESSSVVVVPYNRFYQSGVACRALEASVPVVGPRKSSLAELLGSSSPWLVSKPSDWIPALRLAIESPQDAYAAAQGAYLRATEGWECWLRGLC